MRSLVIDETPMTTWSLGLRSFGKLWSFAANSEHFSIIYNPHYSTYFIEKPPKMLKEKEKLFHWICKFALPNMVGMLHLSLISASVFIWVLYVGKVGNCYHVLLELFDG